MKKLPTNSPNISILAAPLGVSCKRVIYFLRNQNSQYVVFEGTTEQKEAREINYRTSIPDEQISGRKN